MWSRSIFSSAAAPLHVDVGLLDEQQRMALEDRLAGLDRDPPHEPRAGRAITCCIFMASMISSGWPARDRVALRTATLTIVPCIGAGTGTRPPAAASVASESASAAVVLPNASTASGSTASTRAPACRPAGRRCAAAWK